MQEGEIVGSFLFPADQQPPCAVGPGVGSLDDPSSGFGAAPRAGRSGLSLFRNVGHIASPLGRLTNGLGIVAFVGAEMLFLTRQRPRTANRNASERFLNQLLVMHIRAGERHANGNSLAVGQHRSLDAEFASIGRVFPGFFPRPAATWSLPRPDFATASRSPPGRRILPRRFATVCETRRQPPILESKRGSRCPNQIPAASPSTDNRCAARTRFRSLLCEAKAAVGLRQDSRHTSATTVRSAPIKRRVSGETLTTLPRTMATSVQKEKNQSSSCNTDIHGHLFSIRIGSK
jgi:hypothetical protein